MTVIRPSDEFEILLWRLYYESKGRDPHVLLALPGSHCAGSGSFNRNCRAPGCGTTDIKFDVKTDKSQHPAVQPDPGKAVIYFVEDDTQFQSTPKPLTRIGLDGTWVGANHVNSYFYLTVEPGEHHLCANWQSFVGIGAHHQSAAAHFTAEAGQSYDFTVKNTWLREVMIAKIALEPLDSDEGQLLASRFAFSSSHPK